MSGGPWEDYAPRQPAAPASAAPAQDGPWNDYAPAKAGASARQPDPQGRFGGLNLPSFSSVLKGVMGGASETGNAIVDSAVSGFTLPRDVYQGKVETTPSRMSEQEGMRVSDLMGFANPLSPSGRNALVAPGTVDQTFRESVASALDRPSRAVRQAAEPLRGLPEVERMQILDRAQSLLGEAQARGVPLSSFHAIDAASNGVTGLAGLQRHVEAMGGAQGFYARMPEAVDTAGRASFETIAPITYAPENVGPAAGRAAISAVEQSPQGRALTQAQRDAGPRVTPLQAGQVIQPDQRQLFNEGVQRRADLTEPLYRAAEQAPERVGVDRMLPVERPGQPIVTYPKLSRPDFAPDAPAPLEDFRAVRQAGEAGPESLGRFIARNGGLRLDGDAAATDLQRFTVPGVGKVARPDGRGLDNFWRERLIEEGYFRPDADGGMARDISSELLRKLQNEQRGVPSYPLDSERRRGISAGSQSDEFAAAKSMAEGHLDEQLTSAGIRPDSLHPDVRSRVLGEMTRNPRADALETVERVTMAQKEPLSPYVRGTTVNEEMYAPRFGQVNPQSVVDHIDDAMRSARGPVRDAYAAARRLMLDPATGETDLSVSGLNGARKAINAQIEEAPTEVQRALMGVRNRLDAALSVAPEYETARSAFEQASRPLDRYAKDRALGQVVGQDQKSGRFTMAPERVPAAIDAGPSAARELRETNSLASRNAYEGHLRTRLLDGATDASGNVSAERIRSAVRANEDTLAQFPDVRQQLESIATAREGRAIVEQSPVGRLARTDLRTQDAIKTLFPPNPLPNSEAEIARTVGQLTEHNPWAARQVVRIHAESIFNEASQALQTGANPMGGAKYASTLLGNPQQEANFYASVRALPNGDTIAAGFQRLIDVLQAGGLRQNVGSRTAYNAEQLAAMKQGGLVERGAAMLATGGLKLPARTLQKIEEWRLGRNLKQLSRLIEDPDAIGAFRGLVRASSNDATVSGPVGRLVALAGRGAVTNQGAISGPASR